MAAAPQQQSQCPGGGGDSASGGGAAAAHRPMWFAQVPRPLVPTSCNAPVFTPGGMPLAACQHPTMSPAACSPQQHAPRPSTPRGRPQGSEVGLRQDSAPSTPLKQVVQSLTSPMRQPSSWQHLRTPSPSPQSAHMFQLKAAAAAACIQNNSVGSVDQDPCASSPLVVAMSSYTAEAEGYLSVTAGTRLQAQMDRPLCGDRGCAWPLYVFASQGSAMGWVPFSILWRCYSDETGRAWVCDESTGQYRWLDELEQVSS